MRPPRLRPAFALAAALGFTTWAHGDDLPDPARKRIGEFEREAEEIRRKAEADIRARQQKLLEDLKVLQDVYTKAGKLDEAVAIRDRIRKLTPAPEKVPNLLVNGGFEDGPEPPDEVLRGFRPLEKGSTAIKGWVVTKGDIDYTGLHWQPAEGKRSVELNGLMPGAVAQTFKTVRGRSYRVTFRLSGNPNPGEPPAVKKIVVSAAGKSAEFEFDTSGRTQKDMGWVTKTMEFSAVADTTTLEFSSPAGRGCGPAIDDVLVVMLPD